MANTVVLSGNLVRDPEIRVFGDKKLASFSIGVQNKDKDRTSSFFDIEVWGSSADFCEKYIKKGSKIIVTGRLKQDLFEVEGQKRSKIKIISNDIEFSEKKESGGEVKPTVTKNKKDEAENINDDYGDVPF